MTKMKLCPVELTNKMLEDAGSMNNYDIEYGTGDKDHREWFEDVTDECPTVEVVDAEDVAKILRDDGWGLDGQEAIDFAKCLTTNGYQIIRKVEG